MSEENAQQATEQRRLPGCAAFLSGGGEMGERIRTFDWSKTSLGPLEQWPQSLRIAVRIILTSRQPFWLGWGKELIYLYNDPYIAIVGNRHPDAMGQPVEDVWPELREVIKPMLSAALAGQEGIYVESQLLIMERYGYQEETYYTFSYSPIPNDDGGNGGIICANTDDTRRVIGERQLALLRELATKTADARSWPEACQLSLEALSVDTRDLPFAMIYLADPEIQGLSLIGSSGIATGHSLVPAIVSPGEFEPWPFAAVLETHKMVVIEDLQTLSNDPLPTGAWQEPPQCAALVPIPAFGQTLKGGVLVVGLSPFRRFDDDYRNFLSLVCGQISASMASANAYEEERLRAEALAELDQAKTAFFSNVSHEFRTPLTLMLGPLRDLLDNSRNEMAPAVYEQLDIVQRNALRLLKLVNTILDFSRIEAGRTQADYEAVELAAYTADLASTFRSIIERAGLSLIVHCPPLPVPVYVDRDMWEKIVFNLLSNAFKFTLQGEIEVRLEAVNKQARLTVRDTGVGIPEQEIPRIVERFHRVKDARGRTHEGTGIGLTLVNELIKLHGGDMRIESVLDQGSRFIVTVPFGNTHLDSRRINRQTDLLSTTIGGEAFVKEASRWLPETELTKNDQQTYPPDLSEPEKARAHREESRARIVWADDNADMRYYVTRLLSDRFEVEAVADGQAALEAVRRQIPDLVLSDVMMPRLDGYALLRVLRDDPKLREVPFILLSARAGEEARIEGIEAGADDYLIKPFSARELIARVETQIKMVRFRRQVEAKLRENQQRLHFAQLAGRVGVFEWLINENRVIWSPELEELYGLEAGTFEGTFEDWRKRVVPEDSEVVVQSIEAYLRERRSDYYGYEFRAIMPDAQLRWLSGQAQFFYDEQNQPLRMIGVNVDIDERKKAEEMLREADSRKDEFLATLAHELRNPLAPLRNGLELLKLAPDDSESTELAISMMERQLEQMVRLIDDLLDISRISLGRIKLHRERIELAKSVQSAIETTRPLIKQMGHELTLEMPSEPIWLNADATRLGQVFSNLLNNAAKYTEPGGHIHLQIICQNDQAIVKVSDDGIGIPDDMLSKVFELFIQVGRSLDKSSDGLGIGLSLVKNLVEMHGGSIEARSEGLGRGSEFIVCLPLPESQTAQSGQSDNVVGGIKDESVGYRIMVVDDNRDAANSLARILKLKGNETQTAYDGREAIEVAEKFKPEVMLLDIGMPELNGYDTARHIRKQSWGKSILLVALTGWGQEEDRQQSRASGFDFHLVKPVDPASIDKLLANEFEG